MNAIIETTDTVGAGRASARSDARQTVVICALVLGALVFAYRDALIAMVRLWNNSPMYSYGFTVPFVSAYLVWNRRRTFEALTAHPSWILGGLLLLVGLLITVAGRAGGILVLEQVAFLLCLTAAVLLLFGLSYARVGWTALAYLLLMVPLWDGFTESLHEPFQQRSAAIGIWLLHALGIPAFREGTFITLPNLQIEVARVCSGINYLVAVVALGLPLGWVFLRDNWRRALLLIGAVTIAALSNGLRVALICVLAYYEVGSPLHGPFHVLHGLFVAAIGYVVLFAGLRLLARPGDRAAADPAPHAPSVSRRGLPGISLQAALVLVIAFLAAGSNVLARPSEPVRLKDTLASIPVALGPWTAELASTKQDDVKSLWPGADASLSRRYRRGDDAVDVYVGYFEAQTQRKEIVTHRSEAVHSRAVRQWIAVDDHTGFHANYVARDRSGVARMFWYDVDARPETNRYAVKARTLWNAIWTAQSNGAVVVLTTTATDSPERLLRELAGPVQMAVAARVGASNRLD
jgi:EpsI family protein